MQATANSRARSAKFGAGNDYENDDFSDCFDVPDRCGVPYKQERADIGYGSVIAGEDPARLLECNKHR